MPNNHSEAGSGNQISRLLATILAVAALVIGIVAGFLIGPLLAPPSTFGSTIEKIYATGVMIVGTDPAFPPFTQVNPNTKEIEGFDIDLMEEIAAFMGVEAETLGKTRFSIR